MSICWVSCLLHALCTLNPESITIREAVVSTCVEGDDSGGGTLKQTSVGGGHGSRPLASLCFSFLISEADSAGRIRHWDNWVNGKFFEGVKRAGWGLNRHPLLGVAGWTL